MKKSKVYGWLNIGFCWLIMMELGTLCKATGGILSAVFMLPLCAVLTSMFFTSALRRLGTIDVWIGMGGAFFWVWYFSGALSATVLLWICCCAIPLAVSFVWPLHPQIKPLAMRALPVAGLLLGGGAVLFHKLRFGVWGISGIMERIELFWTMVFNAMEQQALQMYTGDKLKQISDILLVSRENLQSMVFSVILMVVYGYFGLFFWSVYSADRKAGKEGLGRMLGPWHKLIPSQGLSYLYMGGYLLSLFLSGKAYENFLAVHNLFGFLFVFTALHRLLHFFRKVDLPPILRKLLIGGLFVSSYFTGGNPFMLVYTVLMFAGWWTAVSVIRIKIVKK